MSTGANCVFEEREPGQWWYRIQRYPYGASEQYDEHGPWSRFEDAREHLREEYANPGGYQTVTNEQWKRRREASEATRRREAGR